MSAWRYPALILALGLAAGAGFYAARTSAPAVADHHEHSSAAEVYQCPMHPWIKSDHPGKCTICGMDLVLAGQTSGGQAADPNLVTLTPASAAVVGVRTTTVQRATLVRTLRVAGVIEDDDTRHRILAARVPGRVEKLFINFVGAEVREGEPLATIYSPEMFTAQRIYVERLKAGTTAFTVSERSASRERLLELGLTTEEITILEHTLEPTAMLTVRSPMSGTVVSRAAYEGQYVQTNDRLFEIGDFSSMWFVFDAHESDLPWLRVGQLVEVTTPSRPGQILSAPITFIDPNLNEATRTVRVRVVLANRDRGLLHKQTGIGAVRLEVPDLLVVPRTAVLQTSGTPVVFVEQGNQTYQPRNIPLGRIGDEVAEVMAGLKEGDRVVSEGGLILDGQAQLAHAAASGGHDQMAMPQPVTHDAAPATHDEAALTALSALALASADGAAALATDDFPGYQKLLPAMRTALSAYLQTGHPAQGGPLATFADKLPDRDELKAARRDFEPFSTALADLVRAQPMGRREGLRIFQCPMSPVLGTGRWLQRTDGANNPFFGSAMPHCGEAVN